MRNALCALLIAASLAPAIAVRAGQPPAPSASDPRAIRRTPVVDVFEANRDAVVNISSKEIITVQERPGFGGIFDDLFDMPFRQPRTRQLERTSVGSGFVIHPDGYICTNAHVVAQTAERKVTFADGREYEAQIVAIDTQRDVAVLKIQADAALHPIKLGHSSDIMIGETVVAIGNPLGLQNTVTAGVVSATNRDLEFGPEKTLKGLIQTDASINPGNSGGPLLNVLGELIGINTAIRGDAQNIGFAIPVDRLREVLPELLDVERRYRVVAGVTVDSLNAPRVVSIKPGSPAETAGLRTGDVVRQIDQRPVHEGVDFYIGLINHKPGDTVRVQVERDGKPVEASLKLASRPAPDGGKLAREKMGIDVQPLSEDVAQSLGFSGTTGLIVTRVEPKGPADRLGLERRDVITTVGRHAVTSMEDLGELLEQTRSGETVPMIVLRSEGRRKYQLSGELTAR
jgi:serine protease Do